MRKDKLVMLLGGIWLVGILGKLMLVHIFSAPVMFDPPWYNFVIDYVPGIIFGLSLIALTFRYWVRVLSEAWAVRKPAAPQGVTKKCHSNHGPFRHSRSREHRHSQLSWHSIREAGRK